MPVALEHVRLSGVNRLEAPTLKHRFVARFANAPERNPRHARRARYLVRVGHKLPPDALPAKVVMHKQAEQAQVAIFEVVLDRTDNTILPARHESSRSISTLGPPLRD